MRAFPAFWEAERSEFDLSLSLGVPYCGMGTAQISGGTGESESLALLSPTQGEMKHWNQGDQARCPGL